jgi:dephospho-CoA kinase
MEDVEKMTNTVMAITGDVGAGKSTAAKLFESLGGYLIDADRVVAELWLTPQVTAAAVGRWGEGILDEKGRVVHRFVAERIFADRMEYDWLMGFIHPLVGGEIDRRLRRLWENAEENVERNGNWAVVEIPLLFETGVSPWVTAKVFVTASRETRLERCRERGWDEAEMQRREGFFLPSHERIARADYVIRNDGDRDALKKAVMEIYSKEMRADKKQTKTKFARVRGGTINCI